MSIKALYQQLSNYENVMDLENPLNRNVLERFQSVNDITFPNQLVELFSCFNGGELFVPGTLVYGIENSDPKKTIKFANRRDFRKNFRIPESYLIFARLNYGDLICIDLNEPHRLIQWDHEMDEEYCSWSNIEEWLSETIDAYNEFEDGVI